MNHIKNQIGSLIIQARVYWDCLIHWNRRRNSIGRFFIFGQGRSGSTLLGNLLGSHSLIDFQDEILFCPHLFPMAHVRGKLARSKKPVYCFHVKIYQLLQQQRLDNPDRFVCRLIDDGWKMIYLRRNNVLRLAVSPLIARERNLWHIGPNSDGSAKKAVVLNPVEVEQCIRMRLGYFSLEQAILENKQYLEIIYERDLMQTEHQIQTVHRITDFLGIPRETPVTDLKRTTSNDLSNDIANLDEILAHLNSVMVAVDLGTDANGCAHV